MSITNKTFVPGQPVWIVERDEDGYACEMSGYVFLAATALDAVIVSSYINDLEDVEDIVAYHIEQTVEDYDTHLAVFPAADCYADRDEATTALAVESGEV